MNTFSKHNIKLILTALFIGVSIIPVHAQGWKKGIQNLPKALSKKPPLTGTAPVVRPRVTPRVPPVLAGAATLNFTVAVNKALDRTVELRVVQRATHTQILQKIDAISPQNIIDTSVDFPLEVSSDFQQALKSLPPIHPKYVLFTDNKEVPITPFSEYGTLYSDCTRIRGWGEKTASKVVALFRKTDQLFFVKRGEQILLDTGSVALFSSYSHAMRTLANTLGLNPFYLNHPLVISYEEIRTKEIVAALQSAKSINSTTQRTAEEIKFLIENLDPNDPLRQTMEQALKSATENGYINPIENSIQQ